MTYQAAVLAAWVATAATASLAGNPIADWDTNGDGALSRTEAAAFQHARFYQFDDDEDGDLKGAERDQFDAYLAFRRSQAPALSLVGTPDANGDGLISAGEFSDWTETVFVLTDQSGDGLLTPDEVAVRLRE